MAKEIPQIKERPEIIYKVVTENEELKDKSPNEIASTNKKGFFNKLFS